MCHTLRLQSAMKEPWLRFQSHREVRHTRTLWGPAARTARSTRNAPGRERLEPRSDLIVRVASQAPDSASQARLCKVVKKHDVIKLWLELELPEALLVEEHHIVIVLIGGEWDREGFIFLAVLAQVATSAHSFGKNGKIRRRALASAAAATILAAIRTE